METKNENPENKSRTLNDDPQYFGVYINMARLNILNISNHVAKIVNAATLHNEEQISVSFLCDSQLKKINWNHAFEKTLRFMPVLKVFDVERLPKNERELNTNEGKDFTAMANTLKQVFSEIQQFRNDYSHYYSTETENKRKITISQPLTDFLTENFKRAIAYTQERMKDVLTPANYSEVEKIELVKNNNKITTHGLVFLVCMFLEREHAFQFIGKITGLKGTQFASFIAVREVIMAFCIRLPHDRFVSENPRQALILDIINELNRCPETLYQAISDEDKKQFRPNLDIEQANKILKNSISKQLDEMEYDQYIENLIRKVRHSNRFPYFALRYIDETGLLGNLCLHINLGKFDLRKYEKQLCNQAEPRLIVEEIKTFGKLSDFTDENKICERIDPNQDGLGFSQFSPSYHISNNRIGLCDNIGNPRLIKVKEVIKIKQPLARAFLSIHELSKLILLDYLEKGKVAKIINDYIKLNDTKLLTLPFINEVKSKMPSGWNEIKRKSQGRKGGGYSDKELSNLHSRKGILNRALSEHGLSCSQVPTHITDYWLNIRDVDNNRSFSDRIKLMKRDCMYRLKQVEKHKLDKTVKIPRVGEMATFIAKDIVDMIVCEEKKKKITSFYYDKLQECLAYFADTEKRNLFMHMVNVELKLNEPGGHPFLKRLKLNEIRRTGQLYELYLKEKADKKETRYSTDRKTGKSKTITEDVSWMRTTFYGTARNDKSGKIETVVRMPVDTSNIPFTICHWIPKEEFNLETWLNFITRGKNNDGKKAIELPTNLFDQALVSLLETRLTQANISFTPGLNYNQLLKIWWKQRDDSTQDFYQIPREYDVYGKKVRFISGSKPHIKDYYHKALTETFNEHSALREQQRQKDKKLPEISIADIGKVFQKAITETEKQLRILQEEDCITLLMLEKLAGMNALKLKNIKTLLDINVPVKETIVASFRSYENNSADPVSSFKTITKVIVTGRKQKDYTILKKYIHDRRLYKLFEYHPADEIPLEWVENQLKAYNTARIKVFDNIFRLEKEIISKHKNEILLYFNDKYNKKLSGNITHQHYLSWIINKKLLNNDEEKFMNNIRNSFSHNEFPLFDIVKNQITNLDSDKGIALQIATHHTQLLEKVLPQIL